MLRTGTATGDSDVRTSYMTTAEPGEVVLGTNGSFLAGGVKDSIESKAAGASSVLQRMRNRGLPASQTPVQLPESIRLS